MSGTARPSAAKTRWRTVTRGLVKPLGWLPAIFAATCAAGLLVRLTVQDRWFALEALCYATPPAVCAAAAGLLAGRFFRLRRRRAALLAGMASVACAAVWFHESFGRHAPRSDPSAIRVLTWNVARGRWGWNAIVGQVCSVRPDVIVLVEAFAPGGGLEKLLQQHLPDFVFTPAIGGLLVGTRGELAESRFGRLEPKGWYSRCRIAIDGREFLLLAVDVPSSFFISRRGPLASIAALVESDRDKPLIVAGDFNTPPDSVLFGPLRRCARLGFESAGHGYGPTWPNPVPVLAIDQVWATPVCQFLSCSSLWTARSDHRPVLAEIILP